MSCMNLYINVLLGSGCSHNFRGTAIWLSILTKSPRATTGTCRASNVDRSVLAVSMKLERHQEVRARGRLGLHERTVSATLNLGSSGPAKSAGRRYFGSRGRYAGDQSWRGVGVGLSRIVSLMYHAVWHSSTHASDPMGGLWLHADEFSNLSDVRPEHITHSEA